MKKKLFKTRLLTFAVFCGLALGFASCANEDVVQGTTDTGNESDKNLTTFVAGDEAKTRTTMDYTSGDFYWEAGDYIYVKDDNGTWQKSDNAPAGKVASFKFKVPGKFKNSITYKVYYPGKNGNRDKVTIPATQTQKTPNSTEHFGVSGDCGTANASKQPNGSFAFALDHQAAYLVFQPYTSNTILKDCYLTKVEVSSDNDITHTYTLDPTTGELTGTGSGKKIILTTKGTGTYSKGFPLTNTSASLTTNGAYMVIKPGTHILKVRYWIKDFVTQVEGTITKNLSSFNYAKNTYYDMTASLDVKNYDGDQYYMWDAQKQYWDGWEWTKNLSGGQTTTMGKSSSNYAKNNTDPRYFHENVIAFNATQSCATLPNINEMSWYAMKGDPRWDASELWASMGHLYKGGMWFKKKSVLQAEGNYSTEYSVDGTTDLRITAKTYLNSTINPNLPSAADASKYFYLPALGKYLSGSLNDMGRLGWYWSRSSGPYLKTNSGCIYFRQADISINTCDRYHGLRAQPFSDFGDN